jgi:signal transduction histidine kinase
MRIELALHTRADVLLHAQLDCLRVSSGDGAPMLRVTLTDVSQRKQAEMDRRITANVVEAREADRRRMAHELHEELGQRLSALKMDLGSLPVSNAEQGRRIADMLATLDDAVATVRRISIELRPMMLDDLGLHAAMDWLANDSAQRLGLSVSLTLDQDGPPLGERASIALYRMMQATLEHIARDARASSVHIELQHSPGKLLLRLQDSGTGWPAPAGAGGPREASQPLHEQARMLGGHLDVTPVPGGGQRYTLHLPDAPPPKDHDDPSR